MISRFGESLFYAPKSIMCSRCMPELTSTLKQIITLIIMYNNLRLFCHLQLPRMMLTKNAEALARKSTFAGFILHSNLRFEVKWTFSLLNLLEPGARARMARADHGIIDRCLTNSSCVSTRQRQLHGASFTCPNSNKYRFLSFLYLCNNTCSLIFLPSAQNIIEWA